MDISGIINRMFSAVLEDAEINIIRDLLDNLAQRRSDTGLAPMEEHRYRELCVRERNLLRPDSQARMAAH
jgi:hypothetical protein